jgi:hypothetical protein
VRCPDCYFCGVVEFSTIPFHLRIALVFRDIIYVINILYSLHLAMCEHFMFVCVK